MPNPTLSDLLAEVVRTSTVSALTQVQLPAGEMARDQQRPLPADERLAEAIARVWAYVTRTKITPADLKLVDGSFHPRIYTRAGEEHGYDVADLLLSTPILKYPY
jgi:hypothetical protein